mgnify:CR=1 FL=1|tara:strand:+ start:604 stop:1281 length:678 start_codon:yes stop_codon:yes gene_type:complete
MTFEQAYLNATSTTNHKNFNPVIDNNGNNDDIYYSNEHNNNALILATSSGDQYMVAHLLNNPRVNPNHADEDGDTALIWSARCGHSKTLALLLDDPCLNLNYRYQAKQALSEASINQHTTTLQILIRYSDHRLSAEDLERLPDTPKKLYSQVLRETKQQLRARFRSLVRAILIFRKMRLRNALIVYAPGGTGFAAAASFKATAKSTHYQQNSDTAPNARPSPNKN